MIQYFFFFFCITLLSSMINCGWYEITRGYIEIRPDGTIRKYGKIFMNWYFYWFQEKNKQENNHVYFSGEQLRELGNKMRANGACAAYNVRVSETEHSLLADRKIIEKLPYFKDVFDCEFSIVIGGNENASEGVSLLPFKTYPDYRFPWYIRDPLAGCITCFASIYSSIVFWAIHLFAYQGFLINHVYGWADNIVVTVVFTWVAYCFSCAFLGTFLYRKM